MPTRNELWQNLLTHSQTMRNLHMRDLFKHDTNRASNYSLEWSSLFLDYSKNIITQDTLALLFEFAHSCQLEQRVKDMFQGKKINTTEDRAVLHSALRCPANKTVMLNNVNIIPEVHHQLQRIKSFVDSVHTGKLTGWTGKPLDTFVNIGIGGSDLGPKLVVDALDVFRINNTRSYFISNVDYQQINELIDVINPETTLFIVSSKSFSTLETRTNAESLLSWMQQSGCNAIDKHFIAISSNIDAASAFGIAPNNVFSLWDWVGGRFSLWSATGMPIALALGYDNYEKLLAGAHAMDRHFTETDLEQNMPVIMALLDVWYRNFFDTASQAFVPYDESLRLLPEYLSQLFMESNGKSANMDDQLIDYDTMPITWGSSGTNAQHAFFQLLHQGTQLVPVEFLAAMSKPGDKQHHDLLIANCFAQSQALMQGEETTTPYNYFPGNKPSNTLLYAEMNPETLGKLLALYEHRTFVQGILWNINSFDQWGVELGKKLASSIYETINSETIDQDTDSSTANLIAHYKKLR